MTTVKALLSPLSFTPPSLISPPPPLNHLLYSICYFLSWTSTPVCGKMQRLLNLSPRFYTVARFMLHAATWLATASVALQEKCLMKQRLQASRRRTIQGISPACKTLTVIYPLFFRVRVRVSVFVMVLNSSTVKSMYSCILVTIDDADRSS